MRHRIALLYSPIVFLVLLSLTIACDRDTQADKRSGAADASEDSDFGLKTKTISGVVTRSSQKRSGRRTNLVVRLKDVEGIRGQIEAVGCLKRCGNWPTVAIEGDLKVGAQVTLEGKYQPAKRRSPASIVRVTSINVD